MTLDNHELSNVMALLRRNHGAEQYEREVPVVVAFVSPVVLPG